MPQKQGAKSVGEDRGPRVQIEFNDETYGSPKKVELPFVMGVMADLVGKRREGDSLPAVKDREFLPIHIENFDDRMRALRPRVEFSVPNVLSGEGNMPVEMTFESMDDFTPDAIARKVESLRRLLEARERLSRLLMYMDGKDSAEKLVDELLEKAQRRALSAPSKPDAADR